MKYNENNKNDLTPGQRLHIIEVMKQNRAGASVLGLEIVSRSTGLSLSKRGLV